MNTLSTDKCDIFYIEVIRADHSKKLFKLSKPVYRQEAIDLMNKIDRFKNVWRCQAWTKWNTVI